MSQNELDLAKALNEAAKVKSEDTNLPTLLILYQAVFDEIGGVAEFARWFVRCLEDAKGGTQIQARMMEALMDGVKVMTDRGMLWDSDGAESVSDEEVDAEVERLTRKMAQQVLAEQAA